MQRVVLEDLTKIFQRPGGQTIRALSELSLAVQDGECLALVGPSGSGKTTALRLIAGLEEPTSGVISIGGTVVNDLAPKKRDVAMVFQSPALYPHMTVYQNLGFGLRLRKCPRPEADRRIRDMAELLGLAAVLDSRPMALSAGQRQRVALGRAMVRRASVLLLDEPLANVDPTLRAQMRDEIAQLRQRFGTTMIYVTHDHVEAMLVGDRVAVLREGVLQQIDEPQRLYRFPANLFVATFVGSPPMNLFPGALVSQAGESFFLHTRDGRPGSDALESFPKLRLPAASAPHVEGQRSIIMGLRPEHITCAFAETSRIPAIRARLVSVQTLGPDTYLRASSGEKLFVARASSSARLTVGQEYLFALNMEQACFFDPTTGERCGERLMA